MAIQIITYISLKPEVNETLELMNKNSKKTIRKRS